jgi:hypothetical protein
LELDAAAKAGLHGRMNIKFLAVIGAVALAVCGSGCYSKVSGGSRMGVPFLKDKAYGNYQRPMAEVYSAAIQVINFNGVVVKESTDFNATNQANQVKTIIGKVMERNVYVRVEEVDPKVTQIVVQARTTAGGSDMPLSHELEKQVALKLAH